jgi:hypothetical protein
MFRPEIPVLGEPAKVTGLTILVSVICNQCPAQSPLILVGAQRTGCPACGALYGLDAVQWDRHQPVPKVILNSTRPIVPV